MAVVIGNQPFPRLSGQCRILHQEKCHGTDLAGRQGRSKILIRERGKPASTSVITQSCGNRQPRNTDLLISDMNVLICEKAKELVFNDCSAKGAAGRVAVQLRQLLVRRNAFILLEEEW